MKLSPPGTIFLSRGRFYWRVHLPGTPDRKCYALRLDGQRVAIPAKKGKSLAESIAWRLWERASKQSNVGSGITLDQVCGMFLSWAGTYYRRSDGSQSGEAYNCEVALRILRAQHGTKPIDDITYQDVLAARDQLIKDGHQRDTINQRVGVWKRFFAWALENRHCSAQAKSEAWAVTPLKRNRSAAPEPVPVQPVPHRDVKRTLPYLPPILRAMVQVQELCGCRPGEITIMRPCDIEKRRGVWIYRPKMHKTEHSGGVRLIVLGPRAQRLLQPYMGRPDSPILQPIIADRERAALKRARRRSPLTPSQCQRQPKIAPQRAPGDTYDGLTYARAVSYAIEAAARAGVEIPKWAPNQLRHACGTRVRRKFGPDAARAVLGHRAAGPKITDRYTRDAIETEIIRVASRPMLAMG